MRRVNPNRMELLRLKRRQVLAQKGHSLLEDKLEKLILEFHRLIKQFKEKLPLWQDTFRNFLQEFIFARLQMSPSDFEELLKLVNPLEVKVRRERILSVSLPRIDFEEKREKYSPLKIPPSVDLLFLKKGEFLKSLFEMVELYLALEIVSKEVLKTRRRVNSLEYILIPYIEDCIRSIETKLNEIEREFLSQIMRIKELIRR